jgi:glycerol-3-phosphate acyltransferase PlsY
MASVLLSLLAGYLLGSFPSALLVGRLKGRSIFEVGSGNMGAMNTARNLGVGLGLLVLLLDVAKGVAAILVAGLISSALGAPPSVAAWSLAAAGVAVAAGHAWSLFARFRGGKALAVTMGMLLPHYLLAGVIGVLIIITLSLLLSEKELAAIISVFLLVPLTALTGWWQQLAVQQWLPFCVALLLVALIVTRKYLTASARTAPVPPPSAAA